MALRDITLTTRYGKTTNCRMAIMEAIVNLNKSNFIFYDGMDAYRGEHYLKLSQMDDGQLIQMIIDRAIDMAWEHDSNPYAAHKKMYKNIFNN